MSKVITTSQEFINMIKEANANGQYVTVYGESDMQLRKFNTDGGPKVHIKEGFQPRISFSVTFHLGQDYEKAMAKIVGEPYEAHDSNRVHLIKNVIMQYISTGNVCMIYMPQNYNKVGIILDGKPISNDDMEYAKRFMPVQKPSTLAYRTLSLKNITSISINHERYDVAIGPDNIRMAA